jgi:hypothetical protein
MIIADQTNLHEEFPHEKLIQYSICKQMLNESCFNYMKARICLNTIFVESLTYSTMTRQFIHCVGRAHKNAVFY